jgi:NADPH2:quinone reductase
MVRALGADHAVDYTQEDFAQGGNTYDLIYDILGKSSYARCRDSLAPNGCYLLASFKMKDIAQMAWTSLAGGKKVVCAMASESAESLAGITELAEAGALRAVIDKRFPLEEAAAAHRYYESGQKRGEVVLTVGQDAAP